MKKSKAIIKVKEFNLTEIKEILKKGNTATFEEKVGVAIVLESLISSMKGIQAQVKDQLEHTPYEKIVEDFESRGLMSSEDSPVIEIGDSTSVTISEATKTIFTVESSKLSEIDPIIPDKYKKIVTSYDKKALEEAYDDDTLETVLKPYVNKEVETVTKFTKKKGATA